MSGPAGMDYFRASATESLPSAIVKSRRSNRSSKQERAATDRGLTIGPPQGMCSGLEYR